jgi:excisionase family DNA binding protein
MSAAAAAPPATYPSLTVAQVAKRLGISEATLFRMISRGDAPPSYRIGSRRRYWRESDVLAWLETRCRDTAL